MAIGATPNWVPTQTRTITTNASEGPGSLRDTIHGLPNDGAGYAIEFAANLPSGIFDMSTKINGTSMQGDLTLGANGLIIKGETCPHPLSITGTTVAFGGSNQEIRHARILPGDRANGPSKNDRDAARVGVLTDTVMENNTLRHCTLAWGVDEALSFWHKPYRRIRGFTVEECILGETLRSAGHPEGDHSTGVLVGMDCRDILIYRSLLASCSYRAPVLCYGATGAMVNVVTLNFNKTYEFNTNTGEPLTPTHWAFIESETRVGNDKQNSAFSARESRAAPGSTIHYRNTRTVVPPALLAAKPWLANIGPAYPVHALVVPGLNVELPAMLDVMPVESLADSLARTIGPCRRTALETRLVAEMLDPALASIKANIAACPERATYGF